MLTNPQHHDQPWRGLISFVVFVSIALISFEIWRGLKANSDKAQIQRDGEAEAVAAINKRRHFEAERAKAEAEKIGAEAYYAKVQVVQLLSIEAKNNKDAEPLRLMAPKPVNQAGMKEKLKSTSTAPPKTLPSVPKLPTANFVFPDPLVKAGMYDGDKQVESAKNHEAKDVPDKGQLSVVRKHEVPKQWSPNIDLPSDLRANDDSFSENQWECEFSYALGVLAQNNGRFSEAANHYRAAIEKYRGHPDGAAPYQIALGYLLQRDWKERAK